MRLVLERIEQLRLGEDDRTACGNDGSLEVEYCGICRTDAKMFHEGQRDLALPRVLGHEAVLIDRASGRRYVPWPARACGGCAYCAEGRENLCERIRIMGFHFDGAFSRYVSAKDLLLFEAPPDIAPQLLAFAEPVGCVVHGMKVASTAGAESAPKKPRIILYGGGTVGLIAAAMAADRGMEAVVIEKNQEKINALGSLSERKGFRIAKSVDEGDFDLCINTCADYIAFSQGIAKLRKGGTFLFFSGMTKNEEIPTNLLNLIHYKELQVKGAYGLTPKDIGAAIGFIRNNADFFASLVQGFVSLAEVETALRDTYTGNPLKYILRFGTDPGAPGVPAAGEPPAQDMTPQAAREPQAAAHAAAIDRAMEARARFAMDDRAKPLGALGVLEDAAVRVCAIRRSLSPSMDHPAMFVFAGDHGISEEGVSAFPREVTAQMVKNFAAGGAAINVLCGRLGIDLRVIDMGVAGDLDYSQLVWDRKIRRGTRNFALEDAMTDTELEAALNAGMEFFRKEHRSRRINLLGLGEMGIGNTSSATMIISLVCGVPVDDLTGRGTGVDDVGLRHKLSVLRKAVLLHGSDGAGTGTGAAGAERAMRVLRAVGGYEIAGMAGAAMAAAAAGIPVVLDGTISTAAGMLACEIDGGVREYLFVGHRSAEKSQETACARMGIQPLLDLGLRLGEGSGAALAMDTIRSAVALLTGMASFEEARISRKK